MFSKGSNTIGAVAGPPVMAFFRNFIKTTPPVRYPIGNKQDPFKDRHVIVPQKDVQELRQQLEDLQAAGMICPYDEVTPAPKGVKINVVYKMNYDYQWFTERSIPDTYDDRNIETILNFLSGYRVYTVIGLISNLSQVPPFPGERKQPYNVRPSAFYELERMQPGYCELLIAYQKSVRYVLKDLHMVDLVGFLDYIVVFASSYEEHEERIMRIMEKIQKGSFRVDLDKGLFHSGEFYYAGHMVLDRGIMIAPDKVETIKEWPLPRTVLELQNYLEFCAYYRHFYEGFSTMAKPLYQLLHSVSQAAPKDGTEPTKRPWWTCASLDGKWTKECMEAFEAMRRAIIHAPTLKRVDMSRGR